ncbi:hypothetical protein [Pontibaca salina]|uniref:Uncharacterized protein n=1 Tax=Pontibaca salina TaxID=2795731 RepID=A0A934M0C4_9RHOB|nr:hypothetical protein [Pontibaca salina]MBI6629608.1 hypothetical protein [Pontibaca salina]
MTRFFATVAALSMVAITPAFAHGPEEAVATYPPEAPYQKVSDLVALPDFLPGMGELYVNPETLPAGPFVAYDHDGQLVSSTYMIPTAAMNPEMSFDNLAVPTVLVDHTDIYYNAGHPGVEEPHIHIVLWAVSPEDEARVAE